MSFSFNGSKIVGVFVFAFVTSGVLLPQNAMALPRLDGEIACGQPGEIVNIPISFAADGAAPAAAIQFDIDLPSGVFTLSNLRNPRQ